jgi:3-deoxy-D-manno-octulosonic-acid transferase
VISGPDVSSFRDAYAALAAEDAAVTVDGAADLGEAVVSTLADRVTRDRRVAAAGRVVARHAGAIDRTFAEIEPMLPGALDGAERSR